MSTIPKEHIPETGKMMAAKKFAEENAKFVADDQSVIMLEKAFIAGYRLATDGREELEKECNQLNSFSIAQTEVITALQSSLKEKEKECEELKAEISRIVYISQQPGGYHP
jgi:predicted site-specific integrase-resolvase